MEDKRTSRINFSLTPENAEFVAKFGKARATGDGRYNFSEMIDELISRVRAEHSPEQTAMELQKKKEKLQAEINDIDEKAKTILGTTLDDFVTQMKSNIKNLSEHAAEEAKSRELSRQEFLDKLRSQANGRSAQHLKAWLTGPGWKEDLAMHGLTVRDAMKYIQEDS